LFIGGFAAASVVSLSSGCFSTASIASLSIGGFSPAYIGSLSLGGFSTAFIVPISNEGLIFILFFLYCLSLLKARLPTWLERSGACLCSVSALVLPCRGLAWLERSDACLWHSARVAM
jgi:hypothetical protein